MRLLFRSLTSIGLSKSRARRSSRDAVDRGGREHGVHGGLVANVALDERGAGTRDGLDAVENHRVGVAQVVVDDDLVARLLQLNDSVAANEAGATGNKNPHKLPI